MKSPCMYNAYVQDQNEIQVTNLVKNQVVLMLTSLTRHLNESEKQRCLY